MSDPTPVEPVATEPVEPVAADPGPEPDPEGEREDAPYYCPGCGRRWNFPAECRGLTDSQPHAPIEVVSTDELREGADPADHTPAPGDG